MTMMTMADLLSTLGYMAYVLDHLLLPTMVVVCSVIACSGTNRNNNNKNVHGTHHRHHKDGRMSHHPLGPRVRFLQIRQQPKHESYDPRLAVSGRMAEQQQLLQHQLLQQQQKQPPQSQEEEDGVRKRTLTQ